MTVYRKFLLMGCVKVVLLVAIIGNCYTGWGETSVSEGGYFATSRLQSSEWYEHCNIVSYSYFYEKGRKNSLLAVLVAAVLAKVVSLRSSALDGIYLIIRIFKPRHSS